MKKAMNALTTKLAGRVKPFLNIPTALMMALAVGGFGLSLWMVEDSMITAPVLMAHNGERYDPTHDNCSEAYESNDFVEVFAYAFTNGYVDNGASPSSSVWGVSAHTVASARLLEGNYESSSFALVDASATAIAGSQVAKGPETNPPMIATWMSRDLVTNADGSQEWISTHSSPISVTAIASAVSKPGESGHLSACRSIAYSYGTGEHVSSKAAGNGQLVQRPSESRHPW